MLRIRMMVMVGRSIRFAPTSPPPNNASRSPISSPRLPPLPSPTSAPAISHTHPHPAPPTFTHLHQPLRHVRCPPLVQFANIRSNLALALRRCQKELSKQMTCSRCAALLIRPARFIICRHVLCEHCVDQTVRWMRRAGCDVLDAARWVWRRDAHYQPHWLCLHPPYVTATCCPSFSSSAPSHPLRAPVAFLHGLCTPILRIAHPSLAGALLQGMPAML